MNKLSCMAMALGLLMGSPALALDHETIIDHPLGPIAADYDGEIKIETKQIGPVRIPGRGTPQRCNYSASVVVDRTALLGSAFQARRSMISDDVITGSVPGRCSAREGHISKLVYARREDLQAALMALVGQDRDVLLAEAESARMQSQDG
ncbi:MAG: hypothetical protein AAF941_08775 [Pseudomonadota bacterium]